MHGFHRLLFLLLLYFASNTVAQAPQTPESRSLKNERLGIEGSVVLAEQSGPNCGRPDAHITVSLIRWTVKTKSEHGLYLEYVSDQLLNLKYMDAPLLLTADSNKKVKPSFLPFSLGVEMGAGRASMDLLYQLAPKDLATLAQANYLSRVTSS
jgi:hypothetical protein